LYWRVDRRETRHLPHPVNGTASGAAGLCSGTRPACQHRDADAACASSVNE
jgi:hypothetical protein